MSAAQNRKQVKISFKDKMFLTKNMSVMMRSGIPILEAIQLVGSQAVSKQFKELLDQLQLDIDNGESLFSAMSRHPKIFDPLYLSLVRIGEKTGTLDTNFEYLAVQMRKSYEFRKKVQGVLIYPAVVLSAAVIAGAGISIFVLPQLVTLFKSLDIDLPLSTRILLGFTDIMQHYGIEIIISFIIWIFVFRAFVRQKKVRPYWLALLLHIPVFGTFWQNVEVSSFCLNMGMMLKSGLPITTALEVQEQATTNDIYRFIIQVLLDGLNSGKSLEETLNQLNSPYIPILMSRMIGTGEKTGKLDDSLSYLSEFFTDEVDNAAKNFSTVLEPLVILLVGGVVAFLAISIITPIYQFSSGIHN